MPQHTNLTNMGVCVCLEKKKERKRVHEAAFHSRGSCLNSHILLRCLFLGSILIEKEPWQASSLGHPLAAAGLAQNIIKVC